MFKGTKMLAFGKTWLVLPNLNAHSLKLPCSFLMKRSVSVGKYKSLMVSPKGMHNVTAFKRDL